MWIGAAVLTVVLAVVGTGVGVATLVVGNVTAQISDVRADLRQIRDRADRLGARLDDVEKAIAGMQVKMDLLVSESVAD